MALLLDTSSHFLPEDRCLTDGRRLYRVLGQLAEGSFYELEDCKTLATMNAQPPELAVQLSSVRIDKPDDVNLILGQAHFIKTVEDLHEALAGTSAHLRFGVGFCESSGPRLIRPRWPRGPNASFF